MEIIELSKLKDNKSKNLKILLYGESMVGKTTFSATFPKPIIVSTDGNFKGLENVNEDSKAIKVPEFVTVKTNSGKEIKKSGWPQLKELIYGLVNYEEVETIVIDLMKDVYDMCRNYVLSNLGIIHESEDNRMGRVWTLLDAEFMPVLRALMTCDKNVILIAHEKEREGTSTTNMIESVSQKVKSYVDINCRLIAKGRPGDEPSRILFVSSALGQITGNRIGLKKPIDSPTYEKLIMAINAMDKKGE